MNESTLTAVELSWQAGERTILQPLDVELCARECLVVIGPNGAGKTTLVRLLAGLLEPTSGEVRLGDRPLESMRRVEVARRMAYVPQVRPARVPLTVREVVLLGRFPFQSRWRLAPGRRDLDAADAALERVGLEELGHRQMNTLSGGERQGVYIAAALAQEADILVLDEPTTHLDPRHQVNVARLVSSLRAAGEHTILLTTHDLNLAAAVADRILALRDGEVVAQGPPEKIVQPAMLESIFDASFAVVEQEGRRQVLLEMPA